MTTIEASEFFKRLLKETDNKREIKIYKGFIAILANLKRRDFTEEQLLLIEDEIKILNLKSNPENKRRYFRKKLTIFKQFLKDKFSLISEGYYTAIGMSLGMCFGVAVGLSIVMAINPILGASIGLSIGIGIGMIFGMIYGARKDADAKRQGRVI